MINPLTPNDHYSGRTAPLTSKRCILYIYSTSLGTEYFKHDIYSPFYFPLQNAVCFIIITCLVPVLFTILYTGCAKIKKKSGAKRLMKRRLLNKRYRLLEGKKKGLKFVSLKASHLFLIWGGKYFAQKA